MKKIYCISVLLLHFIFVEAQPGSPLPAAYLKDSLPALIKKSKDLLDHAYMAQTLIKETEILPGWEGYPVKLYEYKTTIDKVIGTPKIARVYLLNPTPEKLAMWILTTCWEVKQSLDYQFTNQVFEAVKTASGAQFPVMGLVYEDMYTKDFQEPYVFKDGVTVYIKDSAFIPKNATATEAQLEFYLHLTNDDLKPQIGRYGRIISTTRESYKNNGGQADVGDTNDRKIEWLEVVKELYKKAYRSNRNELMIAWAKTNLH